MLATVQGVRVAGVRAAVPEARHSFLTEPAPFAADEVEKLVASIGVRERRVLPSRLCASDMCLAAAEQLLKDLDWDPASVDVLIFISQDPDYTLPATACVMQRRLGLAQTAAAFDINLGCSGFIYGTWIASQLLGGSNGKRALVLNGDTSTRYLVPGDRATLPLFGDAGAATALERDAAAPPLFVAMGTDGNGAAHISIKAGGKRDPLVPPADPRSAEEEERLFKDARLHMNGMEVFGFTLRIVPKLVAEVLAHANLSVDDIDVFVMHQANRFILEHLRKKAKIPEDKFLIDMEEFGNTSSASIPLAITHKLGERLAAGRLKVLMCGFGVGWSWGATIADIGPIPLTGVVEVPDDFPALALA